MERAKSDQYDQTVVARAWADGWQWAGIDPFGTRIELAEVDPS